MTEGPIRAQVLEVPAVFASETGGLAVLQVFSNWLPNLVHSESVSPKASSAVADALVLDSRRAITTEYFMFIIKYLKSIRIVAV